MKCRFPSVIQVHATCTLNAAAVRNVATSILALVCILAFSTICRAAENANAGPEPGSLQKREMILKGLQRRLPPVVKNDAFNGFLKRTGELPPDLDLMPSQFFLPDPMSWFELGQARHATVANWPERRRQLADLTEKWLLGTAPPPPGNVVAEILDKTTVDGREIWNVRLSFGPNHAAKLGVKLYLPKNRTPSGIFVCDSERYLPWVKKAMEQGFGAAVHNARDSNDESLQYNELFGPPDWSAFRRRGWSASRVLDWLVTLPFVDPKQVYIGGHSRSAKAAIAAVAFDQRFAGIIASSPGSGGGSTPYRYCDQSYSGESLEQLTRQFPDWVHMRVRFFAANEDKLPADSHFLYALIAPRPIMMSTATEDIVESTWTVEQVHQIIKPIYDMFGLASNQVLRYRPGEHTILGNETPTAFSDFLLAAQSGAQPLTRLFPYKPLHPWDYQAWAARNPIDLAKFSPVNPQLSLKPLREPVTTGSQKAFHQLIAGKIQWLIGDEIPYRKAAVARESEVSALVREHYTKILDVVDGIPPAPPRRGAPARTEDGESESLAKRNARSAATATIVSFGDGITGCLFVPKNDRNRPLVVWLSAFETAQGYAPGYRSGEYAPSALLKAGYPVFAYDPIGTFYRQEERRQFFTKHPNASLMGKMVGDARQAIDAATELLKSPRPVCLYGFAMGGTVAVLTAGVDERVEGVAAVAGFTPLRTDTADRRTGGLARLSQLYGWLPRLGAFIGHEDRIPVDYNEILASIAPRKVLIVAPTEDRYAALGEVRDTVEFARLTYKSLGDERGIELATPVEENRLTNGMHQRVIDWMGRQFPRNQ